MMTHYELMMRMGRAPVPIQSYYYLPNYISYLPCLPQDAPPPSYTQCTKPASELSDEELTELLTTKFLVYYPELNPPDNNLQRILLLSKQLACRYPGLACVDSDCGLDRFFLLLAHYLTAPAEDGQGNAVSSAHVGDTSISYDTSATQRLPWFFLQLSKTKYGRELISLLDNNTGLVVV